jgi:glycosyltransferase involved in cell wall biosynthesis
MLIDPMNVDEIADAIKFLKDNKEKRAAMSKAALETAAELTVDKRAEKILNFVESKI